MAETETGTLVETADDVGVGIDDAGHDVLADGVDVGDLAVAQDDRAVLDGAVRDGEDGGVLDHRDRIVAVRTAVGGTDKCPQRRFVELFSGLARLTATIGVGSRSTTASATAVAAGLTGLRLEADAVDKDHRHRAGGEEVAIGHGQVGDLARLEAAETVVDVEDLGRRQRHRPYRGVVAEPSVDCLADSGDDRGAIETVGVEGKRNAGLGEACGRCRRQQPLAKDAEGRIRLGVGVLGRRWPVDVDEHRHADASSEVAR